MLEASRQISPVLEVTLVMSRQDHLELDDVALRERGLDDVRENAANLFFKGVSMVGRNETIFRESMRSRLSYSRRHDNGKNRKSRKC